MRQLDAFNCNECADYVHKSNSFYASSEPVQPAGHFDLSTCVTCASACLKGLESKILLGWTRCIFKVKMPLLAIQLSRMLD